MDLVVDVISNSEVLKGMGLKVRGQAQEICEEKRGQPDNHEKIYIIVGLEVLDRPSG